PPAVKKTGQIALVDAVIVSLDLSRLLHRRRSGRRRETIKQAKERFSPRLLQSLQVRLRFDSRESRLPPLLLPGRNLEDLRMHIHLSRSRYRMKQARGGSQSRRKKLTPRNRVHGPLLNQSNYSCSTPERCSP